MPTRSLIRGNWERTFSDFPPSVNLWNNRWVFDTSIGKERNQTKSVTGHYLKLLLRSIIWQYRAQVKMDIRSDPAIPLVDTHHWKPPRCAQEDLPENVLTHWVYWAQPCFSTRCYQWLSRKITFFWATEGWFDHCCREAHRTPLLQKPCSCSVPPAQPAGPIAWLPRVSQLAHGTAQLSPYLVPHCRPLLSYPEPSLSPLRHKTQQDCQGHTGLIAPGCCGLQVQRDCPWLVPAHGAVDATAASWWLPRGAWKQHPAEVREVNTQWSKF